MSQNNLFMSLSDRGKSIKKIKTNKEQLNKNFESHIMELENSESEDSVYEGRKRASTISNCNITLKSILTTDKKVKNKNKKKQKTEKFAKKQKNQNLQKEILFKQTFKKLKNLKIDKILKNHEIDERLRAKMMDWIIEIIKIYNQRESTIFKTFFILDFYFKTKTKKIQKTQIHLIGAVCLFIASKHEEIRFLTISEIHEKILYKKFSKKKIIEKELEILNTINFRCSLPTIYEISRCGFNFVNFENKEIDAFFRKSSLLISKLCLFSMEISEFFDYNQISGISMILVLKIINKLRGDSEGDRFVI